MITPQRGNLYRLHDPEYGTFYCLAISAPYAEMDGGCIAVRVSLTNEHRDFPGWVRLGTGDPAFGYVVTPDIDRVDHDELKEDLGPLSLGTMVQVDQALKKVLGL